MKSCSLEIPFGLRWVLTTINWVLALFLWDFEHLLNPSSPLGDRHLLEEEFILLKGIILLHGMI